MRPGVHLGQGNKLRPRVAKASPLSRPELPHLGKELWTGREAKGSPADGPRAALPTGQPREPLRGL